MTLEPWNLAEPTFGISAYTRARERLYGKSVPTFHSSNNGNTTNQIREFWNHGGSEQIEDRAGLYWIDSPLPKPSAIRTYDNGDTRGLVSAQDLGRGAREK